MARRWLRGGLHPWFFLAVIIVGLWSVLGLFLLIAGFVELSLSPHLVVYPFMIGVGVAWLVGLRSTHRLLVDEDNIHRHKDDDPSVVSWESITDVRLGAATATWTILDFLFLDLWYPGRAHRFEPIVTYIDRRYGSVDIHLEELGRFSTRRGWLRATATVDELRLLAGLEPAEHPSVAELRQEIAELLKPPEEPPPDYVPRHLIPRD